MKLLIAFAFALFIGVASAEAENHPKYECNAIEFCKSKPEAAIKLSCTSTLYGFDLTEKGLNDHVNEELTTSFRYLLLASYYNTYAKNRPGFNKLFQGLSDTAWDNTISLIKHITQRGGKVQKIEILKKIPSIPKEVDELQAMGLALNLQKGLTHNVQQVHRQAEHKTNGHDPHTAHYLEEHFLEPQVETVRKLAGYTTDLAKFMTSPDASLALFIFDEYLQKQ